MAYKRHNNLPQMNLSEIAQRRSSAASNSIFGVLGARVTDNWPADICEVHHSVTILAKLD